MHKDAHEGLIAFARAKNLLRVLKFWISSCAQQGSHDHHISLQSQSVNGIKIITSLTWNAKNAKDTIQISIQCQATTIAISFDLIKNLVTMFSYKTKP